MDRRERRPILSARAKAPYALEQAARDLRNLAAEALEAAPVDGRIRMNLVCSPGELHWHFAHPEAYEMTVYDLIDDATFLEAAANKIRSAYR